MDNNDKTVVTGIAIVFAGLFVMGVVLIITANILG
jgi:hypothetical protein